MTSTRRYRPTFSFHRIVLVTPPGPPMWRLTDRRRAPRKTDGLISQALAEQLTIVTSDLHFQQYGVGVIRT